jgi:ubiquinone/menaquinone biosynthesis C-methylase UbiE
VPSEKGRLEVSKLSWSFDRVADIYDKTRSLPPPVMKKLVSTLSAQLKGCEKILEVGVGTGRIAAPLQKAGFNVVGIDISRKMLSKAREKQVQSLFLADACSTPFMDKAFDVAISVHVLHLICDWKKTLKEVCRVTREAMLSLYEAHEDPVQRAYVNLLKQHGHEQRKHPGKSEQDLQDLISPAKILYVTSYDVAAEERLIKLQHRTSSSQWEVPENLNLKVVDQLKTKYTGKFFRQDLYLQTWSINSLKAFAKE